MGRFEEKVAVVTGGASGIGRATAARLAAEGACVVVGDLDEAALAATVTELGGETRAAGIRTDVTVEADVAALVALAVERFGALHVAVNSAGVGDLHPIVELPEADWDRVVDVCLKGVFLAVKHEARAMLAAGGGVIVNIASLNARQPAEGMSAYCAAKAGVEMLTRTAAMELGRNAIRVVGIGPGLVDTPLTAFSTAVPQLRASYIDNTPLGRAGTVDDIAAAATWLASDEASWVSGDTLYVDGAAHTRGYPRFFDLLGMEAGGGEQHDPAPPVST